ncbi:hypothetical protein DAPPUDRAFT_305150 [Daphnia pulex]|uniref:Uncharacterized protein n=1 Tax=Daphnia pulex TaxID=6669 RepID=E9HVL9_DAPPU|nr:hypothetical protein DAPPUDRAFT_305150 [Daphnia pulex]|eukprot:EFX64212.1 hypothetical protein DAPPUDRAFT_305150 [Daphnia pulex]
MGNPTIYVLVCCFKKGKTELGIGTMDSIVFPKTFVSLPNLEDKIRMLKEFISGKTDVALKFPKHSASGEDPSIQLELRAGHVISFSEDMKVLELTRDAMIKPKSKSARSTKILHSTPKSQVAPKLLLPFHMPRSLCLQQLGILQIQITTRENQRKQIHQEAKIKQSNQQLMKSVIWVFVLHLKRKN